jgi:hypothetical protein
LLDSWKDQSFSILLGFKEKKPSLKEQPALNLDSDKNPSLNNCNTDCSFLVPLSPLSSLGEASLNFLKGLIK